MSILSNEGKETIRLQLQQITYDQYKKWAHSHKKPVVIPCPIIPCPACEAKVKTDKRIHFSLVDADGKLFHATMPTRKYNQIVLKEKVKFFFLNTLKNLKVKINWLYKNRDKQT